MFLNLVLNSGNVFKEVNLFVTSMHQLKVTMSINQYHKTLYSYHRSRKNNVQTIPTNATD